jgi:FkbM family methyltransferase
MILPSHDPQHYFHVRDDSLADKLVIREIWCESVYECNEDEFNDTGICVDLGANIGVFSVWAEAHGATRVLAVEPEPNNIKLLERNIELNKCQAIEVVEVGISNYSGNAVISDEEGGSTIKDTKDGTSIQVETLEWLWNKYELEFIDVLKVDIEGSEADVILNTPKEILNYCRYITIEVDNRTSGKLGELVNKLSETHQCKVVGSHETGGMLFCRRY